MSQTRIDFKSADNAGFHQLRDKWRSAAASSALSRAGLRIAGVLPTFLNREYGFAFPSDEELAGAIGTNSPSTAKRGLISLEDAHLIERQTMVKRDEKGEAIGRIRRIYFTLPEVKVHVGGEGSISEGSKGEGSHDVKVQKRLGEGSPVWTNILDRVTLDKELALDKEKVKEGTFTRTEPSLGVGEKEKKEQPSPAPSLSRSGSASSPAPKPNPYEAARNGDAVLSTMEATPAVPSAAQQLQPGQLETRSVAVAPSPRWQDAKHPKSKQGRPLSREPLPAPRSIEAGHAFLRRHHVPETEWPRLIGDLMDGYLYEYDIEPWMDAA
ncbi:hypothetical protein [Rhizobium sp. HT1-10]|uniref:hypothetical protein n=1 Tax=Rhizobium sp. HT1-10 TaxID=3111638 RepID=UPI003C1D5985